MTIFEQIYEKKEEQFIYDDGEFFVRFDDFPINPGHALLIPVKPIVSIFDLNQNQWNKLFFVLLESKRLIEESNLVLMYQKKLLNENNDLSKTFCNKSIEKLKGNNKISGFNIGNNDGYSAGRTVDHLHIHIIPRYDGDLIKPEGGIRHIIPGMGYYK